MPSPRSWLMLLYQLPARPSTQRVYVWRRLKSCGVAYLQNSVCVLPDRADLRSQMEQLREEIETRRGEARLLSVRLVDASEHRAWIELFQQQSDEEYGEVLGKCRDFHEELRKERSARHFTFAELEENEEELGKIRSWLVKIQERDFFGARSGAKTVRVLTACERDLERYRREVAEVEGVHVYKRTRGRPPGTA